jgi:hypothetical protein
MITVTPIGLRARVLALALLGAPVLGLPGVAHAQLMGNTPWDTGSRSASLAAQFQFQKQYGSGSAGGMSALTQYVTNYNSSSTSIGNYTDVTQTLGAGATGTVTQSATQDNSGTENSNADTSSNLANNGSFNPTAVGKKGTNNATVLTPTGSTN